jgi:phenylacetate-CoA ligase
LQGRTNDMLVAPTGRMLHSLSVIYVLREIQGLRQFKVIQESVDHLVVEMLTGPDFDVASEEAIRRRITTLMGAPMRIELVHVSEIPPDASGKYRWIVSRVRHSV